MSHRLLITDCRLFDAAKEQPTRSILIEEGTIAAIGPAAEAVHCDETLDAGGRMIAPGFIDVHIQGAGGADVLDATPEALATISRTCARFGTTGFLATTVYVPGKENRHLTVAAETVGRDLGGATLLGIHIEGPFISAQKRGMIQPNCVCPPSAECFAEIQDVCDGRLKMMTIAPELPGSVQLIESLVESNVVAAFGHSNATYEQTLDGFEAGVSHVTHLFNAMPSLHHRSPGPLAAIFESEYVTAQLIADGVHIHPAVVRLAFERLGADRVVPITDGMQALGLPDGEYIYNGLEYESREGTARYKDGTLIGTALGLSRLLDRLMTFAGCPLEVAIRAASQNPAKVLGLEKRKGTIETGKDADLVLLDEDCSVYATLVAGKIVYQK
ncbi:MAG: N-acetylglucosamine-6-phosphate deacetylase [Phycisphaerales bacterium]|nr:MAG: N-acetylglucosamine-6-phosphate deacetylase [Phycisphaerales bacterium]